MSAARDRARRALFPGTFDPFTLGHLDLVERALGLFGEVTVAVAAHPDKRHLFDAGERVELASEATAGLEGVDVRAIDGLVVDAATRLGCDAIVRGVRSGTDFDYEVQMARTNRAMAPALDTVLLAPSPATGHISSTLVRQIASLRGDVSAFVPACVARALERRFAT